ncbi:SAM-dependent methyltransferase [Bailinhaonella thermotolerans]|uniref:SAM-dependent methyltransferase n=1 Tax=Bailinhaonella thermotolerans TaxID=1070861 RepID=A0A3A4B683_9ACTN|nr:SAM-dependent methyltransferase [Bailinhaonella thermotolerans]RJL33541.1 SAM-dependent methyltransferase [Bailinhaonella thermotolerans]
MADVVPEGVDPTIPNVARMYDYYLGGKDNFAADRAAAEQALSVVPEIRESVRFNRAFLRRTVRTLAGMGVRQFLDIGTGLPTQNNVHEVAKEVDPDARVVYVDNDAVVLAHARALLAGGHDDVAIVQGDVRRPREILDHPDVRRLIDFDEPVAILLLAIMHFVPDSDDPDGILATLRDALPSGGYLVLSHVAVDIDPSKAPGVTAAYDNATARFIARTSPEIERFFTGVELLEPGVVNLPEWRPEDEAEARRYAGRGAYFLGGVGRKP